LNPIAGLGIAVFCSLVAAGGAIWAAGGTDWRWRPVSWLVGIGLALVCVTAFAWYSLFTGSLYITGAGQVAAFFGLWFAAWIILFSGLRPGGSY